MLTESPFILYSDGEGNIFEDTSLYATEYNMNGLSVNIVFFYSLLIVS